MNLSIRSQQTYAKPAFTGVQSKSAKILQEKLHLGDQITHSLFQTWCYFAHDLANPDMNFLSKVAKKLVTDILEGGYELFIKKRPLTCSSKMINTCAIVADISRVIELKAKKLFSKK